MPDPLFCQLRKQWVKDLPEERVRQSLIQYMIKELNYPQGNFILEKNLNQLPHLSPNQGIPQRRADLIVFSKDLHPQHAFYPLLLVECKAVALTDKCIRQLIGYNQFVQSYFIALANQNTTLLGYYHPLQKDYCFIEQLLPYHHLIKEVRTINQSTSSLSF